MAGIVLSSENRNLVRRSKVVYFLPCSYFENSTVIFCKRERLGESVRRFRAVSILHCQICDIEWHG